MMKAGETEEQRSGFAGPLLTMAACLPHAKAGNPDVRQPVPSGTRRQRTTEQPKALKLAAVLFAG